MALEIGVSAVDARGDLVLWLYVFLTQVVSVMGGAGRVRGAVPRPWSPPTRHPRLLWVVCATPVALVVALALAALGGVGPTQWVGRVIAGETFVSAAVLGMGIVLAMGQDSSLVVAAATLAVAAVFQPARRRIQALVDRRFNRRHHDTTQTVAAFSARLREQIDLDTLSAELLTVAEQTMQPTQVALWLRPQAGRLAHPTP